MTDACFEDVGFHWRNDGPGQGGVMPGNIQHCQESNGQAMIVVHASKPSFDGTVANRCQTAQTQQGKTFPAYPGDAITRQAVRDASVNLAGCTHYLVTYNTEFQPATGAIDPTIPNACADNPWTAIPAYVGKRYNVVTLDWLNNPASNITTVTTRPAGW